MMKECDETMNECIECGDLQSIDDLYDCCECEGLLCSDCVEAVWLDGLPRHICPDCLPYTERLE